MLSQNALGCNEKAQEEPEGVQKISKQSDSGLLSGCFDIRGKKGNGIDLLILVLLVIYAAGDHASGQNSYDSKKKNCTRFHLKTSF